MDDAAKEYKEKMGIEIKTSGVIEIEEGLRFFSLLWLIMTNDKKKYLIFS